MPPLGPAIPVIETAILLLLIFFKFCKKCQLVTDIFVNKNEIAKYHSKRHNTKNTHGTGCTLASAIATFYSCGKTLKKSCEMAINYVNHAIVTGPKYGKGHGPINHLNTIIIKKKFR